MLREFREFLNRGSAFDLAVGVVIVQVFVAARQSSVPRSDRSWPPLPITVIRLVRIDRQQWSECVVGPTVAKGGERTFSKSLGLPLWPKCGRSTEKTGLASDNIWQRPI